MLKRITNPAIEPLDPQDLADHLRVDPDQEQSLLKGYIKAAREKIEQFTGRALIQQTWKLILWGFPAFIELPMPPLINVTSVKYLDCDGNQQTMSPTDYTVTSDDDSAYMVPAYGLYWPTPRQVPNAVEITFDCGYGDEATDVPEIVMQAMRLTVADWYENREDYGKIPEAALDLLWPMRAVFSV